MVQDTRRDVWKVLDILNWTSNFLRDKGVPSPRLDAELLLAHVLGVERIQLYVQFERLLSDEERHAYRGLVRRRAGREPVQYILGSQEFWSLTLAVGPGVLIPRSDTEVLVEEALSVLKPLCEASEGTAVSVADVGTGSGAIAVALATELAGLTVWAGDVAAPALACAQRNAQAHGVAERVHILEASGVLPLWEGNQRAPLAAIVSNPPYIPEPQREGLMPEVKVFEPAEALFSGADGMDVIRVIVTEASGEGVLAPDGLLALEVSDGTQAQAVKELLESRGFTGTRIRDDYAGIPRAVVGRLSKG